MAKYRRKNLSKEEAPEHNIMPYVVRGYCSGGDYTRCLWAAFEMHNETLNAWNMVLLAVISVMMLDQVARAIHPPTTDLVPFAALTAAILIHMPFSVGNHLFCCMSAEVHSLWRRLDLIFQFTAAVPVTLALCWHVYNCWVAIAVNVSMVVAIAVQGVREVRCVKPHCSTDRLQLLLMIKGLTCCMACPVAYHMVKELVRGQVTAASGYGLAAWAVYQLGRVCFGHSFPEKFFPGIFDLVGRSHQMMHLTLIVSVVCQYMFVWEVYRQRLRTVV